MPYHTAKSLEAASRRQLILDFEAHVADPRFPCVGAKSALSRHRLEFAICKQLGTLLSAESLQQRLVQFSRRHPDPGAEPISFVAIFRDLVADEDEFHRRMWRQLQFIHDLDSTEHPWDSDVSSDPASSEFSFSVGGRAFFVVGLHPHSSRLSRRAPQPTLVFNFHSVFEALRTSGRYDKLQTAIRQRDGALQGSINPTLVRFGEGSEARQYSGHATAQCPFRTRSSATH